MIDQITYFLLSRREERLSTSLPACRPAGVTHFNGIALFGKNSR
jgi:hypothetical protein